MFFNLLQAGYVNGKLLHIADPEMSIFDVISSTEFQGLSTQEILGRLRCKHIVVTGNLSSDMEFDKDGLRTLCPLSRIISIQGTDSTFKYDRHITDILYRPHASHHYQLHTCDSHWPCKRSSGQCNTQW